MDGQNIKYRLPVASWPQARLTVSYGVNACELRVGESDDVVLRADSREALEAGLETRVLEGGHVLHMGLEGEGSDASVVLKVDGTVAPREDGLALRASRSAWIHAWLALFASFAGFVASYLYLLKAQALESAWAMKMAYHTAGWHLLLTLTLFPASVWGQRLGIRSVQFVSFIFFLIHLGIALANLGESDPLNPDDPWIAFYNALSGVLFAAATVYGQKAHRDMDPVHALLAWSPEDYRAQASS